MTTHRFICCDGCGVEQLELPAQGENQAQLDALCEAKGWRCIRRNNDQVPDCLCPACAPPAATTQVVNIKHDSYTVYIGRPSAWGNPYKLISRRPIDEARCLLAYARWLRLGDKLASIHTLRGQKLGCYCAPQRCHGDILARLAEAEDAQAELAQIIDELEQGLRALRAK